MIKIAVCDDEKVIRDELSTIIKDYFSKLNRAVLVKDFESGYDLLRAIKFDIIFLDIEMPTLNGIETAKKLRNWDVNSKIIYVTNYNNYKSSAYQVHAFGYISKPIVEKAIFNILTDALRYLDNSYAPKKLVLKTEQGTVTLETDDIYYFEYSVRKVIIVTAEENYTSTSYSLKQIYEKTCKYNFASSHKSYIVNMLHIKHIKGFDIFIDSVGKKPIPLAQKRAVEFKKIYNGFLQSTFDLI